MRGLEPSTSKQGVPARVALALEGRVRFVTWSVMLLGMVVVAMAAAMLFQAVNGAPVPGPGGQAPAVGGIAAAPTAEKVRAPVEWTLSGAELTPEQVAQMSRDECRDALAQVSRARSQPDLDQATRDRLKREFDALMAGLRSRH